MRKHKREQEDLHRLIADKGLGRSGLFLVTGEGRRLPDGSEETSGYILNEDGRVFYFWLGWDKRRDTAAFSEWEEVNAEPEWAEDPEYREALVAAGLTRAAT